MADLADRIHSVDEEAGFLNNHKPQADRLSETSKDDFGPLLTREDLEKLDAEEPIWRRVRLALFIVFWIIWIGLLVASILIIVFTPKCPPRPHLNFWQSKVGYWVDPFAFRDSNGDFIGDLNGLVQKLDYIKDSIGAGFVVLGSFLTGHFTGSSSIGAVKNYQAIDSAVGTMEDFRSLIKAFHKKGMQVVITLDFNSISPEHVWAKDVKLLTKYDAAKHRLPRNGSTLSISLSSVNYYTALGQSVVDLNLESQTTINKIKDVLKFWFGEGVDGVMLDNAAFFVENKDHVGTKEANATSRWYDGVPESQIFTNESVSFVKLVRQVVDEIASASGKAKLLMVNPGNVGYGLGNNTDRSARFLGSEDQPAAHLVVTRELTRDRGWKVAPINQQLSQHGLKHTAVLGNPGYAFSTATPTDLHYGDYISLFTSLLLSGTPLIYYGSELGLNIKVGTPPTKIYPLGKKSMLAFPSELDVTLSQMPMPWDQSGIGFSVAGSNNTYFSNYINSFAITETVESALAVGRSSTILTFLKQLVSLRENPSLLWGDFKIHESKQDSVFDVFVRQATGFPAFIVASTRTVGRLGEVHDFSDVCAQVSLKLAYPSAKEFELDKTIDSSRIYLSAGDSPTIYIFACS